MVNIFFMAILDNENLPWLNHAMTDFDYVLQRLPTKSEKTELEKVARGSGVPYNTLIKLANGATEDPRVSTVNRLVIYYRARDSKLGANFARKTRSGVRPSR
jgi:predicted transcriptional regulator